MKFFFNMEWIYHSISIRKVIILGTLSVFFRFFNRNVFKFVLNFSPFEKKNLT